MKCAEIFVIVLKCYLFGASFEWEQFDFALWSNKPYPMSIHMTQEHYGQDGLIIDGHRVKLAIYGDHSVLMVKETGQVFVSDIPNEDPFHSFKAIFMIPTETIGKME